MELASVKLDLLRKVKAQQSLKGLEGSVQAGIGLLNDIKSTISSASDIKEVSKFMKSIDKVKDKAQAQRAVVGVVGATGSGKSSVINALLDESSLVPTSGMRACTAVITEISYNNSNHPHERYRAEVQFISADEWKHELHVLLDELRTNPGSSGDLHEGEVGVAYSKPKAVYPGITKDDLLGEKYTPESLAEYTSIKGVLGSRVEISVRTADELSGYLQKYIDSMDSNPNGECEGSPMEYWPLVKVVNIFVKSPVLESGLVLVDLPGVHDSNAARSAVAAGYIKECTGLWVVAPITRAVDDKSAQILLGDSFRRQIRMDGSYSSVTFICSKTDDISVEEILRAMPESEKAHETKRNLQILEPELSKLDTELSPREGRIKELGNQIDSLQTEINSLQTAINATTAIDNSTTKVSFSPTKKRKQRAAAVESRKRTQTAWGDYDDSDTEEDELADSDGEVEEIALDEAVSTLSHLKQEQKAALDEKTELAKEARPLRKARRELRTKVKELNSLLENQCLEFRNNFSTPIIKRQFADGLKEINHSMAGEDDPESFDPDSDTKNYQETGDQLPVFCVSSRGYQHQCGIVVQKNKAYPGFRTLEDTQIPQLKAHARDIVREMRISGCQDFLGSLAHCLTSLKLQVVLADKPLKMADNLKAKELEFLDQSLEKLRKDLEKSITTSFQSLCKAMRQKILDKFPALVASASEEAMQTVESWAKSRTEGGLAFATYRAICVRGGVFKGTNGLRNLNEELASPLTNNLGQPWERFFSKSIPKKLDSMAEKLGSYLVGFQDKLEERRQITQAMSYDLIKQKTLGFAEAIQVTAAIKARVDNVQRDANRTFVPTIQSAMSTAYLKCGQERGKGCLDRMREHMREHVEAARHQMFQDSAQKVEDYLLDMLKDIEEEVDDRIRNFTAVIEEDYRSLIEGKNIFETFVHVREELREVLLSADKRFKSIAEAGDDDKNPPEQMAVDQQQASSPIQPIIKLERTT